MFFVWPGNSHVVVLARRRRPSAFDRSETDVRLLATGRCLCSMIVLFNLCRSRTANSIWSRTMRLISSLIVCLGLSACATDYVSQLYEPNYGVRGLHYTESDIDPTLLMNGTYASKQMYGLYGSKSFGVFCLTDYCCSPQAQQSSSGWNP